MPPAYSWRQGCVAGPQIPMLLLVAEGERGDQIRKVLVILHGMGQVTLISERDRRRQLSCENPGADNGGGFGARGGCDRAICSRNTRPQTSSSAARARGPAARRYRCKSGC